VVKTTPNKISPFATHTSSLGASTTYEEGLWGSSSEASEIRDVIIHGDNHI
jgi:hypothetical protein